VRKKGNAKETNNQMLKPIIDISMQGYRTAKNKKQAKYTVIVPTRKLPNNLKKKVN
jgi:hypothetical protein